MPTPTIYTIPPRFSFVDALTAGVIKRFGSDPLTFSRLRIFLPNRRSCEALHQALLQHKSGAPTILPHIKAIGDIDAEETELFQYDFSSELHTTSPQDIISPVQKRLLLADLIQQWHHTQEQKTITIDHATRLAIDLARFLDEMAREECDTSTLKNIVPEELAEHWQLTLDFLEFLAQEWPATLAAQQKIDPIHHRNTLLHALANTWQEHPPVYPVIAAGSTGSLPATTELLRTIATMPSGMVILPSIDSTIPESIWEVLPPTHPQYMLKELLKALHTSRGEISEWSYGTPCSSESRTALLSHAMHGTVPPATTYADTPHLTLIEAQNPEEEAGIISLMLREQLEHPEKTAALVTTNRELARRVGAHMHRWGIAIDDSSGTPIAHTPPLIFLQLVAEMVASAFSSIPLLAALKHPFATGGMPAATFRHLVRTLEIDLFRKKHAGGDLNALITALDDNPILTNWLKGVGGCLAPFTSLMQQERASFHTLLTTHITVLESLSQDENGTSQLWSGDQGIQAADFLKTLCTASKSFGIIDPLFYPGMLEALMIGQVYRPRFGTYPRLAILSPIEARLYHDDLCILAGLNEGSWPAEHTSPWMNHAMREACNLTPVEAREGMAAFDFANLCHAEQVVLTRAKKTDNTPQNPSPWLLKLQNAAYTSAPHAITEPKNWQQWHKLLHQPESITPCTRPAPNPPIEARPKVLSVTQIGMLMHDPYAIYARHILKLKPLTPLSDNLGAAEFGTLIHHIFDTFYKNNPPANQPQENTNALINLAKNAFTKSHIAQELTALWWPRFTEIAKGFIALDTETRTPNTTLFSEITGQHTLCINDQKFTIKAIADRLQHDATTLHIVDYKTGALPSIINITNGFMPQLPLEAFIAIQGGFATTALTSETITLHYWQLTSREYTTRTIPWQQEKTQQSLEALLRWFFAEETQFASHPHANKINAYNDYVHLARVKEWCGAQ